MPTRVLTAAEGFSPGIGFYLSGLEEVREQLREAAGGLSGEIFDRPAFAGAHSIGALVMHIGEAEWWWMQCNVAGHKLTGEDRRAPFFGTCWTSRRRSRVVPLVLSSVSTKSS